MIPSTVNRLFFHSPLPPRRPRCMILFSANNEITFIVPFQSETYLEIVFNLNPPIDSWGRVCRGGEPYRV